MQLVARFKGRTKLSLLLWLFLSALSTAWPQAGYPLWTNQFPNGGSATAIALDTNGNVFVTGSSTNAGANDFTTVAYAGDGHALWTNYYDTITHGNDLARAIAVNSGGTVFVAGSSQNPAGRYDYTVLAYSAMGAALWTNRFHGSFNSNDMVSAACVDSAGRVYVCGSSFTSAFEKADWTTISYSASGVPLWTNRYNDSDAHPATNVVIIASDAGRLLLAGIGGKAPGFHAVAYSTNGTGLWTNKYVGPAFSDYVTGAGSLHNGNFVITGRSLGSGTGYDYATVEYSSNGIALWTNRYNSGSARADLAKAIAVDESSSSPGILVGGESATTNAGSDLVLIKYGATGIPIWTNRYTEADNLTHRLTGLATDPAGNVFLAGYCTNLLGHCEWRTVGFSSSGQPLWTNYYHYSASTEDTTSGIAITPQGHVLITGSATIKYASSWRPVLGVQVRPSEIVLSWTNLLFQLQSAATPAGPFITMGGATSPYTNSLSEQSQFFRLSDQ